VRRTAVTPAGDKVYRISVVRMMKVRDGNLFIAFYDGLTGRLDPDEPDADYSEFLARRSLEEQWPVGVCLGWPDHVRALGHAISVTVRRAWEEDPPSDRMIVSFSGVNRYLALRHDHPDFGRISNTILQAGRTGAELWCAVVRRDLILDVRPLEPLLPAK
jgi:hypothetical protein